MYPMEAIMEGIETVWMYFSTILNIGVFRNSGCRLPASLKPEWKLPLPSFNVRTLIKIGQSLISVALLKHLK